MAWDIILEGRAIVKNGGRLYSKGSNAVPSRLRKAFLDLIDATVPVSYTTEAASAADPFDVVIEHVMPAKRIAIEIIDPDAHDPRTGGPSAERLGPARDIEHAEEIARRMLVKAYVTKAEHAKLNRLSRSFQWDAPGGDGFARYRQAGIELRPIRSGDG